MTFTGLPLSVLLGLFLASLLVVLAVYRLRDYRQATVVASLVIYRVLLVQHPRARPSLRQMLSIAVQVVLLTLLLAALSEPKRRLAPEHQRHILILFDSSASMQVTEASSTRLELGRTLLLRFLETLDPGTEVLLATADVAVTPQLPWTSDRATLRDATRKLEASPLPSRFQSCLENAVSYLAGKSQPELLIVTDGATSAFESLTLPPALSKTKIQALRVGKRQDNVAFLGFAPRRRAGSPADTELLLTLGNFGPAQQRFTVDIFADERLFHSQRWSLSGFETKSETLVLTLGQALRLRAKIRFAPGQTDALALDDEAYAWLGSPRRSRLLVRTPGNLYLEAAVLSNPWVTPTFLTPNAPDAATPQDAVILDGGPLPLPLTVPTLWLNPPADSPFVGRGRPLKDVGFDTWEHQHPMLTELELYDVQIATARGLATGPNTRVLAKSGTAALLVETKQDGIPLVILGFDPKQSDFVLRPAWPLFIEQVTAAFLFTENVRATAALVGTPVTLLPQHPGKPNETVRRVRNPNGQVQQVTLDHGQLTFVPDQLGLYEILAEDDTALTDWFAVNLFSANESRIEPGPALRLDTVTLPTPRLKPAPERAPLARWLVLGALGLLLLEWVSFHRRVTV